MAPAVSASILSATSAAATKRPAASHAETQLDSSSFSVPIHQQRMQGDDDEAARKVHQQPKQQLECPRCQSTNTKFCYYNNYSTAQPRHFCRACRRYWTQGGTLRDVPVGGASRRSSAGGGGKRRKVEPSSSASPPMEAATEDACLTGLSSFPFLTDGSFLLPQFDFDLGAAPAAAFSTWQPVVPSFYDGLAPWGWDDVAGGLDHGWTPPGN